MHGLQLSELFTYPNSFIISWGQGGSDNWGSTVCMCVRVCTRTNTTHLQWQRQPLGRWVTFDDCTLHNLSYCECTMRIRNKLGTTWNNNYHIANLLVHVWIALSTSILIFAQSLARCWRSVQHSQSFSLQSQRHGKWYQVWHPCSQLRQGMVTQWEISCESREVSF